MLISKTIPNLINGVSQQPDSLRFPTQCADQVNAYPSVVEGLTKRLPSEHLINTGITGDASTFTHIIDRDTSERYAVIIRDESIKVFDLINNNEETVDTPDGVAYLDTTSAATAFKATTIADVTFIVNTEKTAAMATDSTPASANTYEALVFVRQGGIAGAYTIDVDDGTTTVAATFTADATSTTSAIATDLASDINAQGNFTAVANKSIVYITNSSADFDINVGHDDGNDRIRVFKGSTQRFTDLPTYAKDGMILKIDGEPNETIDDYYVKFVSLGAAGSIGEGTWEEAAIPNTASALKFDAATMPHVLIRQADNTFVFKKADGATHDTYDYSAFGWANRLVGDLTTNPNPSFIGEKINDVFLFKNRLGFLAGENVIFSESGEFFNFFRITVADLLDTAVIDVASAHNTVAILRHAVPFAEKLVLFSDNDQFLLQGGTSLTPKTVSMAHATRYDCLRNCSPVASGPAILFGFDRGSFSGVREYFPKESVEVMFEGMDISAHIPKYIPGKISQIAAATHESVAAFICDGDTDSLYLYNYFNSGNQRVQSAWHRFEFGTDAKLLGMDFIDTDLYLVVYRTQGVFIEKMAFETGKVDSGLNYVSRLDRRVDQGTTGVSISWDAGTGLTTVTIPYQKRTRDIELITAGGVRFTPSMTDGDTTFTVDMDLTGVNFHAGEAYTMSYTMSDVTLKEDSPGGGRAMISDGRAQIRYGTMVYDSSSFFTVEVTPDYRTTSYHKFNGQLLGSGNMLLNSVPQESGEFRFPVFSKANQVTIKVTNDSPLPCNLMSAEFELNWSPRSRRVGV